MSENAKIYRSVLYIPASRARAIEKARGLACDAIIFDLEDAVSPSEKAIARDILREELKAGGFGYRQKIVRINGLETEWGIEDAKAVVEMNCDAVLLPKVSSSKDVERLGEITGELPIWCMMETPRGILNALDIADQLLTQGFVLGTNDLAKDIGCDTGGDRLALMQSLQSCVLAARASDIVCVDGVYNAFKDVQGLVVESEQGRALGMDGKTLIHPAQIETANRVFAPDDSKIELAKRQIEAFEEATARGEGVAVLDGKIVENLHVETAHRILSMANALRERDAA